MICLWECGNMALNNYQDADFTPDITPSDVRPNMGTYNSPQTFRFWCQKVLPLVYDDSLSYYELLCKVVDYLNKTMEDVNTAVQDVENLNNAFGSLENHVNASETALLQAYNDLQDYVNSYFNNLDVQEEINNKLDAMAEDGTLDTILLPYFNEYVENTNEIINNRFDQQNDKITVLEGRMDAFASLPDGSTTGDAELVDIRVGANSRTYSTAGNAVRGQVSELENALVEFNAFNIISYGSVYVSRTHNGVTYTWDSTNQHCTVVGTASGTSFANIYTNTTSLPLTIGKTYHVKFESTDTNIAIEFLFHGAASEESTVRIRTAGNIVVPSNTTGLTVRLRVLNGASTDGVITWYGIFDAYSNQELSDFVNNTKGGMNTKAHMFSVGNSILTGSVWLDGTFDHLSSYENSPYGNVAMALNVPQNNVNHLLLSNAGLISDGGLGSFLTNIKATDLSDYDYLLTHLWYNDMLASKPLGDQTSTADDGTVAGGVVELVEYIKSNNGQCKLILVSIPPYTGTENVFDLKHGNGKSTRDLDNLMHRLANLYHFIYIDWQQLALSYYYQNYTDGNNVHANNETTYRVMGEYLAMNIRSETKESEEDAQNINNMDVLRQPGVTFVDRTNHGVDFTWTGRKCHVYGTATGGRAFTNLYYDETALPDNVSREDYVYLRFKQKTTSGTIGFEMIFYDAEQSVIGTIRYTNDHLIQIPSTAAGMIIRIYVNDGVTIDGDVTVLQLVKVHKKSPDVPLIVSFIDDDTSGQDYVEKYYYACKHNGVKGNYAVMTYQIDRAVQKETLLGYEDEGFGMLTHCYRQNPTITPYWSDDNRTEEVANQCRANLAKGLREMREYGFTNYNHFVIPGGHTYPDLMSSARMLGLETAISTANRYWNNFGDYDKYFIKRISFEPDDSRPARTMQVTKDLIDACVAEGVGWVILTTHFNEWGSVTWDDTLDTNGNPIGYSRFNEIVQYALSAGFTPMNYCEAWSYFKNIYEQNRQAFDQYNVE